MRFHATCLVVALVSSAFPARVAGQDTTPKSLMGTWKLVSAKYGGQESPLANDFTTFKHFTPTHFMWVSFDKAGKVTRTGGGPYTYDGKTLEETPAYGLGSDFNVVHAKRQTLDCKVEGKRLYHKGALSNGRTLEEVWELVEK
jgi:hypothetical protein